MAIVFLILWQSEKKKVKKSKAETATVSDQLAAVTSEKDQLISKYAKVIDADAEAKKIQNEAQIILNQAKDDAKKIRENAQRIEAKASEDARLAQQNAAKIIADAPEFRQIAQALTKFIQGCNIAGHNLDFDLRFVFAHGADLPTGIRFYDTLDLAHLTVSKGDIRNYKLDTLCDYYGIWREQAHRSLSDCYATSKVFTNLFLTKHLGSWKLL